MEHDKTTLNFKSAGAKADANRDAKQGKQFGIGNFFAWAMKKYPKLTLGQLEMRMPQLEREYGQEKAMRKAEPNMKPSVNSAFDDRGEEMQAKGIPQEGKSPHKKGTAKHKKHMAAMHAESKDIARLKQLAGLQLNEEEVEKIAIGHVDAEADMLRKELFKIGKYSVELYKMLGKLPDADFPHWWQAKIVKAGDYIGSAKHYLEGELEAPEEKSPLDIRSEVDDEVNPSGV